MTLLDTFRTKKQKNKGVRIPEQELNASSSPETVSENQVSVPRTKHTFTFGVLRAPHITEKAARHASQNTYVFVVSSRVNKIEVRQAVERKYKVRVRTVRVVNTHGKQRRRGPQIGLKPGFKKAIVTLKEGQTIEIQ